MGAPSDWKKRQSPKACYGCAMRRVNTRFASYSWFVLGYGLLVIVWGAMVRATKSGAGCGSSWPECNGELVPSLQSVATAIEYTHRLTSGIALIAVIVQWVWAYRGSNIDRLAKRSSVASLVFMILEALIGASLALLEYVGDDPSAARAAVIGVHLVNTFLLVAALTLTHWWAANPPPEGARLRFDATSWWLGVGALLVLITGASGAITALGDTLFPVRTLAEGLARDAAHDAHFLVRLRVIHPLVAVATFVYLLIAVGMVQMQKPITRRIGVLVVGALLVQTGIGLLNLGLLVPLWTQMLHLLVADLVWIALIVMGAVAATTSSSPSADAAAPVSVEA